MATVLRNVGLRVTEHLVQKQKRRAGSRAAFAVLLPGLARGCSNDAYMNTVLRTCSSGAADMTLLLQFGNESKQSASLLWTLISAEKPSTASGKRTQTAHLSS